MRKFYLGTFLFNFNLSGMPVFSLASCSLASKHACMWVGSWGAWMAGWLFWLLGWLIEQYACLEEIISKSLW